MIKIEVKSSETRYVTGTSKRGKPFAFYKQEGFAHLPDAAYPVMVELSHDKVEDVYAPGMYQLMPASLYVDGYHSLCLGRLKLQPVAASARTAA